MRLLISFFASITTLTFANEAFFRSFGGDAESVIGRPAGGILLPADKRRVHHLIDEMTPDEPAASITVTNYEQAAKFAPRDFGGIVCDESSALKAFDGTTRAVVTELMREMPYRLLGTATAAPNDYLELGTSSEALGELGYTDMLTRFFVNDQRTASSRSNFAASGRSVGWRFKGHAQEPFWRWVASWARAIRRPSDYGYDDGAFVLPRLTERTHLVEASRPADGALFDVPAIGLAEEREEARRTLIERCGNGRIARIAGTSADRRACSSAVMPFTVRALSRAAARVSDSPGAGDPGVVRSGEQGALVHEEGLLDRQAVGVPAERAVGAQDAVAGHERRDLVLGARLARGPDRARAFGQAVRGRSVVDCGRLPT